jgi:hypothetical protein
VDELTASASETFAAGMQSLKRARVFGAQTMGQALPASTRRLPNGDVLMHAVGDFVTATGQSVEGDGVIPDEAVPIAPAALAAGRDPVLEAALAWIDRRPLASADTCCYAPNTCKTRTSFRVCGSLQTLEDAPDARIARLKKREPGDVAPGVREIDSELTTREN